ncbi:MAG: pyridoxal phosphate-dependent aminotransferase [Alphaproteobacteria bacterium]|nr:pyridoxal phosphate-dependent aminotransferase [Alphaproteobacteria bacterium]
MKPLRPQIAQLQPSLIREVANAGIGRSDVLAFWFGESDEISPIKVRQAAIDSLQAGETFYAHNLGLPPLREAVARYTQDQHGQTCGVTAQRIAVTSGGVSALMLAMQAILGVGDECLVVTPIWPNLLAQPQILGARVRTHSLRPFNGLWQLDLKALLADITPETRLLVLNAPNNPTGWHLTHDEQLAILSRCRETGTWILADEVYERLYYGGTRCAPSFLDLTRPDDAVMVAHSFSKSFLMTGWRLGWLVVPESMLDAMGKLIEFKTSCAPVFVQRAAMAALARQDEITPPLVRHLQNCRDTLVPLLQAIEGVEAASAAAGMYVFFRLPGHEDGLLTAKRLVSEAGLGLAPGEAFGPEAAGWLRWCFASRDLSRLHEGAKRLQSWLRGA